MAHSLHLKPTASLNARGLSSLIVQEIVEQLLATLPPSLVHDGVRLGRRRFRGLQSGLLDSHSRGEWHTVASAHVVQNAAGNKK